MNENDIKLALAECARIMTELHINEDSVDFIDELNIIMTAIRNEIAEIAHEGSRLWVPKNELRDALASLRAHFNAEINL